MLNTTLRKQLNELKLTSFVELLDTNYELYLKQGLSFSEILSLLSDAEIQNRHQRRIERLIKAAKFRYPSARLENITYTPSRKLDKAIIQHLASGGWLEKKQNLLIFGATGTGKTWLSCAIGIQACRQGYETLFITAHQLLEELSDALLDGSLIKLRRKLIKSRLLIIDDFALGHIDIQIAPLLLEIIDLQSMNGSLMITSQFSIEHWHDKFSDSTIADALLDRVINQAHIIELKGKSMRKVADAFDG